MSLHQNMQTDHMDSQNVSSRSSSYYELDINYSPRKEKLYLQLQTVNKGKLGQNSGHHSLHHIPLLQPVKSSKPVTEDIKDKFLEEIMPIYVNYVASKKKKQERQAPVNYCGFDINVSSDIKKPIIFKINAEKAHSTTISKEYMPVDCTEKEIKVEVTKQAKRPSKTYAVNFCPTTTDTTTTGPKKKAIKGGSAHKEKGKLTTRKIPQTTGGIEEAPHNNAGDATLQRTPLQEDTTEEALTSSLSSKQKNNRKVKPETATVSTQVKPKELKAINVKIKQNDSTTEEPAEASTSQINNKEVYFILVSQSGFEKNKPIKIPISANELQKRLGIDGAKLIESQQKRISNKEIQTKNDGASVCVQASSIVDVANTKHKHYKRVKKKIDADSDSDEEDEFRRRRIKPKRHREVTQHIADSSSTYAIPVKEKGLKVLTADAGLVTKTADREVLNHTVGSNTINASPENPFLTTAFNFQNKSKTKTKLNHGTTKSTNTENQFFLARHVCLFGNKKTDVSVQVKNGKSTATDNRTNETVLRAEISFSDLNLSPVLSYYMNPSTISDITRNTSVLLPRPIREPCDLVRYYAAARARGAKIQHRTRNSPLLQNTVETCKKRCDNYGFEVEGIEPPKKIGFDVAEKSSVKSKLCSSHFPVIEIIPDHQTSVDVSKCESVEVKVEASTIKPLEIQECPKETLDNQRDKDLVESNDKCWKTLETIEEGASGAVANTRSRFRGSRSFARWRAHLLRMSRRRRVRTHAKTLSGDDSQQMVKSTSNNLGCITEESHSHVSTDVDKKNIERKLPVHEDMVKNMKKVDVHLALTIDRVLKLGDTSNNLNKETFVKHQTHEKKSPGRDSEKSTKVSLLSETDDKKSVRTSIPSRPSNSSDGSGNIISGKRKKKKKFRPMIPVRTCRMHNAQSSNKRDDPQAKETGSLVKVRSSTVKSFWGKSQKRSDSTVATRMGPSLKSTQLVVSCGQRSSISSRKPLASTCLFTKDYRNSKTKLSAFQKRKLYGEYLRKAKSKNHSVHSICEIVVCDGGQEVKKTNVKKNMKVPKSCNQELKVEIKESPMRRFKIQNSSKASKHSVASPKTTSKPTPVKRNPQTANRNTAPAVRRITTLCLNTAKMKLKNQPNNRRNCFVLMEMFNNKRFEADSSSSVLNKDSYFENLFKKRECEKHCSDNSSCSEKSNNTVPTASEILEEVDNGIESAVFSNQTKTLLNNIDAVDHLIPKVQARSCENSFLKGKHNIWKKLGLHSWKLMKSFSYCDVSKGKVSCIGRVCSPPPDTHMNKSIITTEKFSTDSLEKSHHPPMEKDINHNMKALHFQNVVPRQNVTIVAYNTEIKYDNQDKDIKSDAKIDSAEMTSVVTVEESGYESNKSKNTLKSFFKRKFNFFKSSKLEIAATRDQQIAVPLPNSSDEKPDQLLSNAASSVGNGYFRDLSKDRISLSGKSSTKKSRNASQSSNASDSKRKQGEATEVTDIPIKIKIKKNNDHKEKKPLITFADLCSRSPASQGVVQFCYTNNAIVNPVCKGSTTEKASECQQEISECKGKTPFDTGKKLLDKRMNEKRFKNKLQGITRRLVKSSRTEQKVSTEFQDYGIYSKAPMDNTATRLCLSAEKSTHCELPSNSQKEVIAYLENKFKELERKIDLVTNNTKILQEASCMCSESELQAKDVATDVGDQRILKTVLVAQTTNTPKIQRGKPKKIETAIGTDSKVSKEVNTEKFTPKKQQTKKGSKANEKTNPKQGKHWKLVQTTTENDKQTNTSITSGSQTNTTSTDRTNNIKGKEEKKAQPPFDISTPMCCGSKKLAKEYQKYIQVSNTELLNKKCACPTSLAKQIRNYQKNVSDCQEYAQKVRIQAEMRKEGHQEDDFRELPLSFLLGKPDHSAKLQGYTRSTTRTTPSISVPNTSVEPSLCSIEEEQDKRESGEKKVKDKRKELKQEDAILTAKDSVELHDQKVSDVVDEASKATGSTDDDKGATTAKEENSNEQYHTQYTDQELFDKLLESYERENDIAERLSKDDEFFEAQLSTVRSKESVEKIIAQDKKEEKEKTVKSGKTSKNKGSLTEIVPYRLGGDGSVDQFDVIATAEERVAEHQMQEIEKDIKIMEGRDAPKVQFSGGSLFQKEKGLDLSDNLSVDKTPRKALRKEAPLTHDNISVEPKEIGKCFRRGFRPDNIVLTGEPCLKISEKEQRNRVSAEAATSFIDFSERDTPLEFLLGLGFSVDEASNAIKDEDVKNRLNAAITEARVWINRINATQGTMLYLVAFKTRPKTMRYFLQLVEAIINQRIVDAVRLDGFLKLLEKIEEGNVNMVTILGIDKIDDEQNEENMVKKQLRKLFYDVYKIAEQEAAARNKQLSKEAIILLRILAAKYRAGLQPHLELIAKYIGQGLLSNEVQLEAAMIYLARVDTADVNLRDFEEYCGISCPQRPKEKDTKETKK